jgi:deoxyribodipyrimidine photo-lyase
MSYQVVWFKRDLRIHDHAPLLEASRRGPVLPLYIVEPDLIHAADYDPAHWTFTRSSLIELRANLARLGQPLIVRVGDALDVLRQLPIAHLWSHEETGNAVSYARDRRIRRWARDSNLPFTELPANGVVRRLNTRDGWSKIWEARMALPVLDPPPALPPLAGLDPGPIPTLQDLHLGPDQRPGAQPGGESHALDTLDSFLSARGANYHAELSSPLTAEDACSRLSAYLAYGNLSTKQVVQAARRRLQTLSADDSPSWRKALRAFDARIHWRCHFMQKLEDAPRIEHENFVRAYDGMREPHWNDDYFHAWLTGRTGYPFIDACMRMLADKGWINFRMRAMLVSFSSYHLWLHWRRPAVELAKLFVDYEPGIHYSQFQMQSGTTGINTLRMYSPLKQALDQDPTGEFVRRWVPEADTDAYPAMIVDHKEALALARQRIGAVRRRADTRAEAAAIMEKHGSRKRPATKRAATKRAATKRPARKRMLSSEVNNPVKKGTKKSKE